MLAFGHHSASAHSPCRSAPSSHRGNCAIPPPTSCPSPSWAASPLRPAPWCWRGLRAPLASAAVIADLTTETFAQGLYVLVGVAASLSLLAKSTLLSPYIGAMLAGAVFLSLGSMGFALLQVAGSALDGADQRKTVSRRGGAQPGFPRSHSRHLSPAPAPCPSPLNIFDDPLLPSDEERFPLAPRRQSYGAGKSVSRDAAASDGPI